MFVRQRAIWPRLKRLIVTLDVIDAIKGISESALGLEDCTDLLLHISFATALPLLRRPLCP